LTPPEAVADPAPPVEDVAPVEPGDTDVDFDWDHIALWRCDCAYVNAGSGKCSACGARNPDAPKRTRGQPAPAEPDWTLRPSSFTPAGPRRSKRAGSRAMRTVAGTIVLNVVVQFVTYVVAVSQRLETAEAIGLSLASGLAFYTICAFWVLGRSAILGVKPTTGRGTVLAGFAEGAVVGGGLAIVLTATTRLAAGHPVIDPVAALLTTQSAAVFLVGAVVIAVMAPVVEELVFRGFLAEAIRPYNRFVALMASAAAFSIAHLRFAQFRYYVAMGVALGLVYFHRGLVGSIAAHACFNGMLLVVAVAASHGPPVALTAAGASITVPAAWHEMVPGKGALLSAIGPAGSRIDVGRFDPGTVISVQELADRLSAGTLRGPAGTVIEVTSVGILDIHAGRAVMMKASLDNHEGRVVMLPKGSIVWIATLETAGSARAQSDFQHALNTLTLPEGPAPTS